MGLRDLQGTGERGRSRRLGSKLRRFVFPALLVGVLLFATVAAGTVSNLQISGPNDPSKDTSPTFHVSADSDTTGLTLQCWVGSDSPSPCTDGNFTASNLGEGQHVFHLQANDDGGVSDEKTFTWTVDSTQPNVHVSVSPTHVGNNQGTTATW